MSGLYHGMEVLEWRCWNGGVVRCKRDTPISERFTTFTYICIIYWLCIVFIHKDR